MEPEGSLPHSQVSVTLHLGLPTGLFPSGFPTKTLYTTLFSSICTTCPDHLILLNFITETVLGEEYWSLSSSLCSFLHSLVTSSLLGPNILLNTLFSKTLSLRSSLKVSDQVSHPYKTTGKFIVLYICISKDWYYAIFTPELWTIFTGELKAGYCFFWQVLRIHASWSVTLCRGATPYHLTERSPTSTATTVLGCSCWTAQPSHMKARPAFEIWGPTLLSSRQHRPTA